MWELVSEHLIAQGRLTSDQVTNAHENAEERGVSLGDALLQLHLVDRDDLAVGALDLFVDECVDYCGRLLRAGVPTELIVYPGCFHGFQMAAEAQVTMRSHRDSLNALKKALVR